MATIKDHQQAMVDLLASGSGIPASASRLAHAMHDVLGILLLQSAARENATDIRALFGLDYATTPGMNDKALARDIEACCPKADLFDRARAAERRVKELENTVKQLRASNAKLRGERDMLRGRLLANEHPTEPEQAGCRKQDTQVCSHHEIAVCGGIRVCCSCGVEV